MKQLFTSTRLFLYAILLGCTFSNVVGQTTTIIDYQLYTTKAHPYMIPNFASGTEFTLVIKTGHPVYIAITNMDSESGDYYKGTAPSKTIIGDTVLISAGDVGHWLVQYRSNSTLKSLLLNTNYQVDLEDQTIASATYGDYPDFIWVSGGASAKLNALSNFNPTGTDGAGWYKWKQISESSFDTGSSVDSVRMFNKGTFVCRATEGVKWTNDTISILEQPTFNSTTKTLNFTTTTTGITYKLLKVGSISGTDTTWTETQNFVGDGNIKNITLTDGKYKLTTTLGIHTSVYPYGYFVVSTTTAVEKTKEENINYRLTDNNLLFDKEVNLKFYSLQGQLLQQGQGNSFKLCRQAGIFKATDKNGNVLTEKILLK